MEKKIEPKGSDHHDHSHHHHNHNDAKAKDQETESIKKRNTDSTQISLDGLEIHGPSISSKQSGSIGPFVLILKRDKFKCITLNTHTFTNIKMLGQHEWVLEKESISQSNLKN